MEPVMLMRDAHCTSIRCMRTTINVDGPVLRELKRLARSEKKTLGAMLSELLAEALAGRRKGPPRPGKLAWHTTGGGLLIDLTNKERLWEVLDAEQLGRSRSGAE